MRELDAKPAASSAPRKREGHPCPPVEDAAANKILDVVAHCHGRIDLAPHRRDRRANVAGASPLGYSSGHQVANDAKTGSGTTGKSRK